MIWVNNGSDNGLLSDGTNSMNSVQIQITDRPESFCHKDRLNHITTRKFPKSCLSSWKLVSLGPWTSYQIRKIAGCACARNAGNVFPRRRFQSKPLVSDPGMHHGTCATHVPWCMSGSLTCGDGKTFPAFPAHAHPQFCVSGKRPMGLALIWTLGTKPLPGPVYFPTRSSGIHSWVKFIWMFKIPNSKQG